MSTSASDPRMSRVTATKRVVVLAELDALLFSIKSSPRYASTRNRRSFAMTVDEHEPSMRTLLQIETEIHAAQRTCGALSTFPTTCSAILKPFLDTILFEDTSAFLTSVAISCLYKLVSNDIIDKTDDPIIFEEVVSALGRCRFESTDSSLDEIVFMKALQVLTALSRCDASSCMMPKAVYDLVSMAYRICKHHKCTDLLRRTAELTLADVLISLFARVRKHPEQQPATLIEGLVQIMEFLVSICDTTLGLSLMITAVEAAGFSLAEFPSLLFVVQDQLCATLLRNLFSASSAVMSHSMRCMQVILLLFSDHLVGQTECLIVDGPLRVFAVGDHLVKDMVLDTFLHLCTDESFMDHVFASYDCSPCHTNLYDELCRFFSKHSFPSNDLLPQHSLACFDCLSLMLNSLLRRCGTCDVSAMDAFPIAETRRLKIRLAGLIEIFNKSPKKGLAALKESGLLPSPANEDDFATELAIFFRAFSALGFDPVVVGEFLGDPDPLSVLILKKFTSMFDFRNWRIDDALRMFLSFFRLPGEAQKIDRMVSTFSEQYYSQCASGDNAEISVIASSDCAYVLSFSIIMLNTDLHNPQVKHKMSLEQFIKNNKGINAGQDLPNAFLESIYLSIRDNQIFLAQPLHMAFASPFRWREIVNDERRSFMHRLSMHDTSLRNLLVSTPAVVREMFLTFWGPAIAAISVVYDNTHSASLLHRAGRAFVDCARVASCFRLHEIVDKFVVAIARSTTVLNVTNAAQSVMAFGTSERALLGMQLTFEIAHKCGDNLRDGWRNVIELVFRLTSCAILSGSALLTDDVCTEDWERISRFSADAARRQSKSSNFNFLSIFSSNDEELARQAEAEGRMRRLATECNVFDLLYVESKFLGTDALKCFVRAILMVADGQPLSTLSATSSQVSNSGGVATNGIVHKDTSSSANAATHPEAATAAEFDVMTDSPTSVVLFARLLGLEVLLKVALYNRDRVSVIWPFVADYLGRILRASDRLAQSGSALLLERAALGMLRVATRLMHREDMRPALAQSLSDLMNLPEAGLPFTTYIGLAKALSGFVLEAGKYISSASTWRIFLALFVRLAGAVRSFDARKRNLEEVTGLLASTLSTLVREHYWVFPDNIPDLCGAFEHLSAVDPSEESLRIPCAEGCLSMFVLIVSSHGQQILTGEDASSTVVAPLETLLKIALLDATREDVQHMGLVSLQRALLAPECSRLPGSVWLSIFERVVFVLLERYVTTVEEYELRLFRIASMTFLNALGNDHGLQSCAALRPLWVRLLQYFSVHIHKWGSISEVLLEALPELVKNMVLVMRSQSIFSDDLSEDSRKVLVGNEYFADLLEELFTVSSGTGQLEAAAKPETANAETPSTVDAVHVAQESS